MGNTKRQIFVRTREKVAPVIGKQSFQANIIPNMIISDELLYERLGARTGFGSSRAKMALTAIESYILEELEMGNRVDLELVSFYPRLSGALPARDADPESVGVFVRGAVKARGPLHDMLRSKLDPVNELSRVRPRITAVADSVLQQVGVICAGHELELSGRDIPIDVSRPDEGIWLEKRRRGKIASAEVIESQATSAKFIFHETPDKGKYTLVLCTRCGRGVDFMVRRCLYDVEVL